MTRLLLTWTETSCAWEAFVSGYLQTLRDDACHFSDLVKLLLDRSMKSLTASPVSGWKWQAKRTSCQYLRVRTSCLKRSCQTSKVPDKSQICWYVSALESLQRASRLQKVKDLTQKKQATSSHHIHFPTSCWKSVIRNYFKVIGKNLGKLSW